MGRVPDAWLVPAMSAVLLAFAAIVAARAARATRLRLTDRARGSRLSTIRRAYGASSQTWLPSINRGE